MTTPPMPETPSLTSLRHDLAPLVARMQLGTMSMNDVERLVRAAPTLLAALGAAEELARATKVYHEAIVADTDTSFCLKDEDKDWNLDHHQEITVTVGDVRKLAKALAAWDAVQASNKEISR